MRRSAGFTLVEVMIAVAALGALAAIGGGMGKALHDEDRHAATLARDLSTLQRAVDRLDDDLRSGAFPSADWTLDDGDLRRGFEVVASGVALFEVVPQGETVRVRLSIAPGNAAPGARGPVRAEWTVRPRVGTLR